MRSKKQSKAVKVVAGKSAHKLSANGQTGGVLSVNGGTNPIPAVQADEAGGVQSVNGGTNPIPAVNKAKSATAGS